MKSIDRIRQNWRIRLASRYLAPGSTVLDLGSADGVLFERLGKLSVRSMGIDPTLMADRCLSSGQWLRRGWFPKDVPRDTGPFDAIVMLAVIEHFPNDQHQELAEGISTLLRPGGRLIITVPSPRVDHILRVLRAIGLVKASSLHEHHGYDVGQTTSIFTVPRFALVVHRRFQLGLNNIFVFERCPLPPYDAPTTPPSGHNLVPGRSRRISP